MEIWGAFEDPFELCLIQGTLERLGHVTQFHAELDALIDELTGATAETRPALLLLSFSGDEHQRVLDLVRVMGGRPDRPRIVVLAPEEGTLDEAAQAGADRVLPRPVDITTLLQVIAERPKEQPRPSMRLKVAQLHPGSLVDGKYELQELIGAGGMGKVYRARHVVLGEEVALKLIKPLLVDDEVDRQRFLREARMQFRLVHPKIATLRDCGLTRDGVPFIAMDLCKGEPLAERIYREAPLPEPLVIQIGLQVASALATAHALGMVHRDLKPGNILIEPNGQLRLIDFGLAKLFTGPLDPSLTNPDLVVGTPHYMSPEQATHEQLDGRADVYSLGCILFECLTGVLPFEGTARTLLHHHVNDTPAWPSELSNGISTRFESLLIRLLAKYPQERPTSEQLVRTFQSWLDSAPPVRPLRILVADDSLSSRRLLAGLLTRWGHEVLEAEDGMTALANALAVETLDLLLLDREMPGLAGEDVAERLRALYRSEGRPTPWTALMSAEKGLAPSKDVDQVLRKPINAAELQQLLERLAHLRPAMESDPVFDRDDALTRTEGDEALLSEALQLLLQETERTAASLREHLREHDAAGCARVAHGLKGAAANCGAKALATSLAALESSLRQNTDVECAREPVARVEQEISRLRPVLLRELSAA